MLDNKRRLVLVRRDEREHLLLLGGVTDVVVERIASSTLFLTLPSVRRAIEAAITPPQSVLNSVENSARPIGSVFTEESVAKQSAKMNSFQQVTNA